MRISQEILNLGLYTIDLPHGCAKASTPNGEQVASKKKGSLLRPGEFPEQQRSYSRYRVAKDNNVASHILVLVGQVWQENVNNSSGEAIGHVQQHCVQPTEPKTVDNDRNEARSWTVGNHVQESQGEEEPKSYIE